MLLPSMHRTEHEWLAMRAATTELETSNQRLQAWVEELKQQLQESQEANVTAHK